MAQTCLPCAGGDALAGRCLRHCGVGAVAVGYSRSYVCPFGSFHQPDPVLGWRGKPNFSGRWRQGDFDVFIAQTENGFRRLDHGKDAEDVESTVYVLGDSFVWGYGTSQGENIADQLNFLMPRQQVENFGLAGAGTVQEYAIFEMHVKPRCARRHRAACLL